MSNLPDKTRDSVQKEYGFHCGSNAGFLLNAPFCPSSNVNTWTSHIMRHTPFALRTVWYIYIVKTDSLTAGQIPFYPSSKRTEICSLHQCTVQDEGWKQRQRGRKTGKSAVVSMVGSVHLMGWNKKKKKLMWAYYVGKWAWGLRFSVSVVLSFTSSAPLQLQEIITRSAREEEACFFRIVHIWSFWRIQCVLETSMYLCVDLWISSSWIQKPLWI